MPDANEIPTKTRSERFFIGFVFGAMSGFFGILLWEQRFYPALIGGLVFGLIIGALGAFFGKRVFDFLIEFIRHFG